MPESVHAHATVSEGKEEITERVMLGLAQPLLICSLDKAKVKDTAIKWIWGRREEEVEEMMRDDGGGGCLRCRWRKKSKWRKCKSEKSASEGEGERGEDLREIDKK